jgi:hypothetical protein
MTKSIKILGLCIAIAITGLSLGNALTGHGIKGNKNLNPVVLADGTSGSGSGTDSATGSGTGEDTGTGSGSGIDTKKVIFGITITTKGDWYFPDPVHHPTKKCKDTVKVTPVTCENDGSVTCTPSTITETTQLCIENN